MADTLLAALNLVYGLTAKLALHNDLDRRVVDLERDFTKSACQDTQLRRLAGRRLEIEMDEPQASGVGAHKRGGLSRCSGCTRRAASAATRGAFRSQQDCLLAPVRRILEDSLGGLGGCSTPRTARLGVWRGGP